MDFKFDIRILAASLLLHFCAYGLLSFYTDKAPKKSQAIEVVIRDESQKRTFLPSKPADKDQPQEETRKTKFVSEKPNTFEKETLAQLPGNLKNSQGMKDQGEDSQKKNQQKKQPNSVAENVKSDSGLLQNLLPSSKSTEKDSRQSTVNFQVPNISKGDFTFLNSDFATYASFYNRITPKIIYNWSNNLEDIAMFPHMREKLRTKSKWSTRFELILDKKGYFKDLIIITSSGSSELDNAVQDALRNAGPYLNPPTGMIEKDGLVHINGEFTVYTARPRFANPY